LKLDHLWAVNGCQEEIVVAVKYAQLPVTCVLNLVTGDLQNFKVVLEVVAERLAAHQIKQLHLLDIACIDHGNYIR
jgi:hypothetical protein